jgi:hypothetical protein
MVIGNSYPVLTRLHDSFRIVTYECGTCTHPRAMHPGRRKSGNRVLDPVPVIPLEKLI